MKKLENLMLMNKKELKMNLKMHSKLNKIRTMISF
jgi:hypothetical protein